jgi:hypothetical protein
METPALVVDHLGGFSQEHHVSLKGGFLILEQLPQAK